MHILKTLIRPIADNIGLKLLRTLSHDSHSHQMKVRLFPLHMYFENFEVHL